MCCGPTLSIEAIRKVRPFVAYIGRIRFQLSGGLSRNLRLQASSNDLKHCPGLLEESSTSPCASATGQKSPRRMQPRVPFGNSKCLPVCLEGKSVTNSQRATPAYFRPIDRSTPSRPHCALRLQTSLLYHTAERDRVQSWAWLA